MADIYSCGGKSDYACRVDGDRLTVCVLGRIAVQFVGKRKSPPQPYSGFVTSTTAMGAGHIFALELGGSDGLPQQSHNIVPMWLHWQQTGRWRALETELAFSHNGQIFRADLSYDAARAENRDTRTAEFWVDPFVTWDDRRIPTEIRVRAYNAATIKTKFDAFKVGDDDKFLAETKALDALVPTLDRTFDMRDMPPEDRRYWQTQLIGISFEHLYGNYQAGIEARETGLAAIPFCLHPETLTNLKAHVAKTYPTGFTPDEVAALQLQTVFLSAIGGSTVTKFNAARARSLNNPLMAVPLQKTIVSTAKRQK